MSGPWEKFQEVPAQAPEGPWSKFEEAPAEVPKPDEWQSTKYGFKVKPAVINVNGKETAVTMREDGAVNFPGTNDWWDAKGNKMPAGTANSPSFMRGAMNAVLNTPLGSRGLPVVEQFTPPSGQETTPTVGRVLSGAADAVVAPAQLVAHVVGSNIMDKAVDTYTAWKDRNLQKSTAGEALGQMAPVLMSAGASAAPGAAQAVTPLQKALAYWRGLGPVTKGALTGAVAAPAMTPEAGVQSEGDFWQRKGEKALAGGVIGGAIPAAVKAGGALAEVGAALKKAPSPGQFLEELGARFAGKAPGQALQDAANAKYNAAWDEFKAAVAPVDAESGSVKMDYAPAIDRIKDVLGVGKVKGPVPIGKEAQESLERLLANLEEAQAGGSIDNSFSGAIDTVKWLGAEQRRLAVKHGDTEARALLGSVRDSILDAMQQSSPKLSQAAAEARGVFAKKVAPLFDKSEGGNFLTQIRDSATPGDLLVSGNQGTLSRVKPDKAAIIARGSSADPMLYSYLDHAINEATKSNNPRIFADSIKKAMPAIEAIGSPEDVEAFKGLAKVADFSNKAGHVANLAVAGAAEKMGFHTAGGAGVAWGLLKPGMSGPGFMWKALQAPATRKLLSYAAKLPANDPYLELIAKDIAKASSAASGRAVNVAPLRTLPTAASTGTPDQIAENK